MSNGGVVHLVSNGGSKVAHLNDSDEAPSTNFEETTDEDILFDDHHVAVDVEDVDDETTRLFTVSDEEDGLLRITRDPAAIGSQAHGRRRGQKSKPYPKELKKTIVAIIIMITSFIMTTASLSIIHEWMPEYKPLPDQILDRIPYQSWALKASEVVLQIQVTFGIALIVFHRHR